MCPPCKVIFDQGFYAAADGADLLRQQLTECCPGRINEATRDDLMLELGRIEAAAIAGVRDVRVAFAEALGEPEWAKLFASA